MDVTNCEFRDNYSSGHSAVGGGSIIVFGQPALTVRNSHFSNCTSANPKTGTIQVWTGTAVIADTVFEDNNVDNKGIDIFVNQASILRIAEGTETGSMKYDNIVVANGGTAFKGCKQGQKGKLNVESASNEVCSLECTSDLISSCSANENKVDGEISDGTMNWPSMDDCDDQKNGTQATGCFCLDCKPGFVSVGAQTTCRICGPGTHSNTGHTECIECAVGKASLGGDDHCEPCGPGFVSGEKGEPYCIACKAGKVSNSNLTSTECVDCPSGTWSGKATDACAECEPNHYSDKPSSDSCARCGKNKEALGDRTGCVCAKGFVAEIDSGTNGTYGTTTCLCAPGYTLDGSSCVVCRAGSYKEQKGNEPCNGCDQKAVLNSFVTTSSIKADEKARAIEAENVGANMTTVPPPISGSNCSCEKGYYLNPEPPAGVTNFTGECLRCPDGANCDARGTTLATMKMVEGNWRSGDDSNKTVECYTSDACKENAANQTIKWELDNQCARGHTGPICNVCREGYSKTVAGVCEECEDTAVPTNMVIFFVLASLASLALVYAVFVRPKKKKKKGRKKALSLADGERSSSSVAEELVKMRKDKKNSLNKLRSKFKILASFYQIVSQFESTLSVRFPRVFEEFCRWVSSIANLDFVSVVKVGCVVNTNFYR